MTSIIYQHSKNFDKEQMRHHFYHHFDQIHSTIMGADSIVTWIQTRWSFVRYASSDIHLEWYHQKNYLDLMGACVCACNWRSMCGFWNRESIKNLHLMMAIDGYLVTRLWHPRGEVFFVLSKKTHYIHISVTCRSRIVSTNDLGF